MATVTGRATRYAVRGMTCGACVRRVERALSSVPAVTAAHVELTSATARVEGASVSFDQLRAAVVEAGYELGFAGPLAVPRMLLRRPFLVGPLAGLLLLSTYFGLLTLAQGWDHALQQFEQDRFFVVALAAGLGVQAGLFTALRGCSGTGAGMAASTGMSGTAMLACCAHHLTDVLPILGIAAVSTFLGAYRVELLWLSVALNLADIAYLLWQLRAHRSLASAPPPHSQGVSPA